MCSILKTHPFETTCVDDSSSQTFPSAYFSKAWAPPMGNNPYWGDIQHTNITFTVTYLYIISKLLWRDRKLKTNWPTWYIRLKPPKAKTPNEISIFSSRLLLAVVWYGNDGVWFGNGGVWYGNLCIVFPFQIKFWNSYAL